MRDGECRSRKARHALQQRSHEAAEVADHVVVARVDAGDVATGAERAPLAAEHQGADSGLLCLVVGRAEISERLFVEGVQLRRGVQGDVRDVVGDGQVDHACVLPAGPSAGSDTQAVQTS